MLSFIGFRKKVRSHQIQPQIKFRWNENQVVLATLIALLFAQLGVPAPEGLQAITDRPSLVAVREAMPLGGNQGWFPAIDQQIMQDQVSEVSSPAPPIQTDTSYSFNLASAEADAPAQTIELSSESSAPFDANYVDGALRDRSLVSTATGSDPHRNRWFQPRRLLARKAGQDYGLGYERVMFAPTTIDTAVTSPYIGFRIRSERGLGAADRLEFLWAKPGRGPGPESRVDLIDYVYRTELGNEKAALISELGMRALNPEVNSNTVGFGDMVIGGKALVYDGKCTKLASIFLTHLNTGPADRGLGTGHVSLEPGMLMRHRWSDATYLHGEVKYRIPIAGTANFAGDVVKTGWAISTVWRDSDQIAWIPTLELQTHSFLFGGRTLPNGSEERVDSVTAMDILPGMRLAFANSPTGTWEAGFAGGVTCADREWFDTRMMVEIRWLK